MNKRSFIAWPGTLGPDPQAAANPYIREDGGIILREDGSVSDLTREKPRDEDQQG